MSIMKEKTLKFGVMAVLMLAVFFIAFLQFTKKAEASESVELANMLPTVNENILYDKNEEKYFDLRENGYIDEIYEVRGGEVVRLIPIQEYINQTEAEVQSLEEPHLDLEVPLFTPYAELVYKYTETSNDAVRIFGERASIIQDNPGPGADTFSLAYSSSYSHQFSISVNADMLKAIKLGVGYSYTETSSITSTHSMTINAGYSGYWRFDPNVRRTMGSVKNNKTGDTQTLRAYYPMQVAGKLDGTLVAVKTPLKQGN